MKKVMTLIAFVPTAIFLAAIAATLGTEFALIIGVAITLLSLVKMPSGSLFTVVQNPLIGAAKQKMGNAVFATWKGVYVLKTKPLSVGNPKTDRQLMQRSAMAQIVLVSREILGVIRTGFKKLAVKKSEYNVFVSYALKNAFDFSAPPVATLLPAKLLISKGTIATTPITAIVASLAAGHLTITFPVGIVGVGQSVNDVALAVAYNETKNLATGVLSRAVRADGTVDLDFPAGWELADSIIVYLGFSNPVSGQSSDSVNETTIIAA